MSRSYRSMIIGASMVGALFASTPVLAQQKLVVSAPDAAAARPISVINRSGSYVLSRNIVNNSKTGADSVAINSDNVVLDLNGFSIIGNAASGAGVNAAGHTNIVVRDGVISGMGGPAIVTGANSSISGITATGNCTAASAGPAIQAGAGSQISSNTVNGSLTGGGISCGTGAGCLVRDNVIQGNAGVGITLSDSTGGYRGNVLQGNSGITTPGSSGQVLNGTSLGGNANVCNGVPC